MTTVGEICDLAEGGESETVEFKKTTGERKSAAKALSAMLNGQGGSVLFGVHPDGRVTGQNVADRTLENITQACEEIHPRYPPSIERISVPDREDHEVLVVTVGVGASKPYSYKGRYYQRSGASTVEMPDEIQLSLVLERAPGWDRWETADSQRGFDAIDEVEVRAFRDEAITAGRGNFDTNASVVDVLRAMNLLDRDNNPNRAAVALFGRPEAFGSHFPTLGCRLVAVTDTQIGEEFRDDLLIVDNVFTSLRRAMSFCEDHLHHPVRINGGLQAGAGLEIPSAVIREALANAFSHRNYATAGLVQVRVFSDRLEVLSPGGLPFGLTPSDLYVNHGSHPWNPNMMGCLYRRGIVEQLGSGTLRMARICSEAGLGRPVFTTTGASVTCSVPRQGKWLAPDGSVLVISDPEATMLARLANGPVGRGDLAAQAGISDSAARGALARLRELGLVRVEGHGRGAYWTLSNSLKERE